MPIRHPDADIVPPASDGGLWALEGLALALGLVPAALDAVHDAVADLRGRHADAGGVGAGEPALLVRARTPRRDC